MAFTSLPTSILASWPRAATTVTAATPRAPISASVFIARGCTDPRRMVNCFAEEMIRFRVAADALDRLEVTYSPLLEAVLSLHVLAAPRHHALQHGWVRAMRRLSVCT